MTSEVEVVVQNFKDGYLVDEGVDYTQQIPQFLYPLTFKRMYHPV